MPVTEYVSIDLCQSAQNADQHIYGFDDYSRATKEAKPNRVLEAQTSINPSYPIVINFNLRVLEKFLNLFSKDCILDFI